MSVNFNNSTATPAGSISSALARANSSVDSIHIDCDVNYFNTKEQIRLRDITWFEDFGAPAVIAGSSEAGGFFSHRKIYRNIPSSGTSHHLVSMTVIDGKGESRKILSTNIDYYASSSLDSYRNGVDITSEKHWTAGIVKISAGTAGHLLDRTLFGVPHVSIIAADRFEEIDVFDPVRYVESGGDPSIFTYPIVTSDTNQRENYVIDGIIEAFPIRSVVSNFSINHPFEPHSVMGQFGNGNIFSRFDSDQVLSVDYIDKPFVNKQFFLDAVEVVGIEGTDFHVGPAIGYVSYDRNVLEPFEDVIHLIQEFPVGSRANGENLFNSLNAMRNSSTTYITPKEHTGTCGFVYDNAYSGTESVTYGGMLF